MDEEKQQEKNDIGGTSAAKPDEVSGCEAQRDEYLNSWKRSVADFINYKKDESRRFSELMAYGTVQFVKDLLPILDSFDALDRNGGGGAHEPGESEQELDGLRLIHRQLLEFLKKRGIEKIEVKKGDTFNPEFHEAMLEVEMPPDDPEREKLSGKILEELASGYNMEGRILRATKVKLAK